MENLFNSPSIERKAIAIGAIHGNRIHGNRIVGESVRSGKFAKRWKRIHPWMDAEGGEGGTDKRQKGERTQRTVSRREWRSGDSGGPLQRLESNGETNQTKPSRAWNQLNRTHREREKWRGGGEGLAKRQTYLIQVGWSQWQEEAGARRREKRIEGRVWYSLDGPRKKIYLASLFDVGALFNYSGRKTWRERLFNQRFERVEAESSASKSGKLRAEGEGKDNIWPRDRLILAPISAVARFSND